MYRREYIFICDTSFLLALIEKKLFSELVDRYMPLKLLIPRSVYRELERLMVGGRRLKVTALFKLMNKHSELFSIIESRESRADEDVIKLAMEYDAIVATADRTVRRRANELGLKTIFIRDSELYIN